MNAEFILVGIIFILIIFVSSYGTSTKVVPYTPTSSVLPQYKYSSEGFEEEEEVEEGFEGFEEEEEVEEGFEGFEGYEEEEVEEGFEGYEEEEVEEGFEGFEEEEVEEGFEGFEEEEEEEGFALLSGSFNRKSDPVLDGISHLPGRPECIGKSSYLSNSMGGICLDKQSIDLIKTRGHNFS